MCNGYFITGLFIYFYLLHPLRFSAFCISFHSFASCTLFTVVSFDFLFSFMSYHKDYDNVKMAVQQMLDLNLLFNIISLILRHLTYPTASFSIPSLYQSGACCAKHCNTVLTLSQSLQLAACLSTGTSNHFAQYQG